MLCETRGTEKEGIYPLFECALTPLLPNTESLYLRPDGFYREAGNWVAEENRECSLSLDAYYNLIPVRKLRKYTSISALRIQVRIKERKAENLKAILYAVSDADESVERTVGVWELCDKVSDLECAMDVFPEDTACAYLKITASQMPVTLSGVTLFAYGVRRETVPAIIICTFRREKWALENITYLLSEPTLYPYRIILADNGGRIPSDVFCDERLSILRNRNTGGSGGFACGMKEAVRQGGFTHMILMDDDIRIDAAALRKLLGFLSFRKAEYDLLSVSGSMLNISQPTIQFEAGGNFNPDTGIQTGFGHGLDLSERESLLENERERPVNYGAWWMMCMPICYAERGEYPAPFFIKYDDVEYSLRCNLQITTLNGVGVWHESFAGKYNSVQEYFNTRNYLWLMRRLRSDFKNSDAFRAAMRRLLDKLYRQQYRMADAVIMGYRDFLTLNPKEIDYDKKLEELRKLNYSMRTEQELTRQYGTLPQTSLKRHNGFVSRCMRFLLYGHLLPPFLCAGLIRTDTLADSREEYFRADAALHFCQDTGRGYVTKKSLAAFIVRVWKLFLTRWKFNDTKKRGEQE